MLVSDMIKRTDTYIEISGGHWYIQYSVSYLDVVLNGLLCSYAVAFAP
jgi:hypothetical protein